MKNQTVGSFTLIKNEINFIKDHLDMWLPCLDSMTFYDGNSTDGTLEILRKYAKAHSKITLKEDKDIKDFEKDYQRLSNECMWDCKSDIGIFLHPDMFPVNGEILKNLPKDMIAATAEMESFAGEPKGPLYRILGRGKAWKNIYRLRNPNLGAHYFGSYGAQNEDTYFSEITGNDHKHYGTNFNMYPYPVVNSGLKIQHYSDVRPYARRLERMKRCLKNQGYPQRKIDMIAAEHPRVSLVSNINFKLEPLRYEI
jgi:hypothetical protein